MSAHAIAAPLSTAPPTPALHTAPSQEQAAVLRGLSWSDYVKFRDAPENRSLRMTYDRGVLEIMTLGADHEIISRRIDRFINEWTLWRAIPLVGTGSLTLRLQRLDRGLEGDQSYYIAHESQVRGLPVIDLERQPAPDLGVEVDHTSSSLPKMPIYAAMGVAEVWRWSNGTLTIHHLVDGEYVESNDSQALPGFPWEQLRQALTQRHEKDETTMIREFRQWLQDQSGDGPKPNAAD